MPKGDSRPGERKPRRILRRVLLVFIAFVLLAGAGFWCAWTFIPEVRVRTLLWEIGRLPKGEFNFDFYVGRSREQIWSDWERLGPETVPALSSVLRDQSVPYRYLAADRLRKIGDKRASRPLIEALQDSDFIVRKCAVNALADLKCREAGSAMVEAIRDPELSVANSAQAALRRMGDPQTAPLLTELLTDPSRWVRGYASWALGDLGNASSIPQLRLLFQNDPDPWVRDAAKESLSKLTASTRPSRDDSD